jgi:hypothetical protein
MRKLHKFRVSTLVQLKDPALQELDGTQILNLGHPATRANPATQKGGKELRVAAVAGLAECPASMERGRGSHRSADDSDMSRVILPAGTPDKDLLQSHEQRLDSDEFVLTDDEPELALIESELSEPGSQLACCAVHALGMQTPDGRWWCWSSASAPPCDVANPTPCPQIERTVRRWRREMLHQLGERAVGRSTNVGD